MALSPLFLASAAALLLSPQSACAVHMASRAAPFWAASLLLRPQGACAAHMASRSAPFWAASLLLRPQGACAAQMASKPALTQGLTLITFDVDGTLVKGAGKAAEASAHARAFAHAVGLVLGTGAPTALPADILPPERYHGSTDGLIVLNMARTALGLAPEAVTPLLPSVYAAMYAYFEAVADEEVTRGIEALPGVLPVLELLAREVQAGRVVCGLVTGNVEGIARKKMRTVGVIGTGVLSPPCGQSWAGEDEAACLGGFGSDFCSGDIDSPERNHLDRAEQIAIATRRARALVALRNGLAQPDGASRPAQHISRVVHVGDAPSDVLAAKACADDQRFGPGVVVGCIAVGTGRFAPEELRALAGARREGVWEPHVLARGVADPAFLDLALGRSLAARA